MSHRLMPNHIAVSILPSCIALAGPRRAGERASGAEIMIGKRPGRFGGALGEDWALGPLFDLR